MQSMSRRALLLILLPFFIGVALQCTESLLEAIDQKGYRQLDLQKLSAFPFDDRGTSSQIPPAVRSLDGTQVQFLCKVWSAAAPASQFQLVHGLAYENRRPPAVQERVSAKTRGNLPMAIPGPSDLMRVRGTLHVGITRDTGGDVVSVFRMDVDEMVPAPSGSQFIPIEAPAVVGLVGSWLAAIICWGIFRAGRCARLSRPHYPGLCPCCDYDLPASTDRCPECGTPVSSNVARATSPC
jgi:hypothetical protein